MVDSAILVKRYGPEGEDMTIFSFMKNLARSFGILFQKNYIKFFLIGGVSASLSVGLLYFLVDIAHAPYLVSYIGIFVFLTGCAYLASRRFAFSATSVDVKSGLLKYFAITTSSLILNACLMVALVEIFGLRPVVANMMLCVLNAPLNYLAHRKFTFRID